MTIILHDHAHTIRAGRVPPEVVLDLAGMLSPEIRLRIQPDENTERTTLHDPGYFGLAVALARRTWED
jgi:hypothetical protein